MRNKIYTWFSDKESQQALFQRVNLWVMLLVGGSMLAVGISAFKDSMVLLNSQDIDQVRQAVPWAVIGSVAITIACYCFRKPFDIATLWLGLKIRNLLPCSKHKNGT